MEKLFSISQIANITGKDRLIIRTKGKTSPNEGS